VNCNSIAKSGVKAEFPSNWSTCKGTARFSRPSHIRAPSLSLPNWMATVCIEHINMTSFNLDEFWRTVQ